MSREIVLLPYRFDAPADYPPFANYYRADRCVAALTRDVRQPDRLPHERFVVREDRIAFRVWPSNSHSSSFGASSCL